MKPSLNSKQKKALKDVRALWIKEKRFNATYPRSIEDIAIKNGYTRQGIYYILKATYGDDWINIYKDFIKV